jgi:hypothetical protein
MTILELNPALAGLGSPTRLGVQIKVVKKAWCVTPLVYNPEKQRYVRNGKPNFVIRSRPKASETLLAKIAHALNDGKFDQTENC